MINIKGTNKGKIILYTLSTCMWCMKTKKLLKDLGVAYSYVDVDLLDEPERTKIENEIDKVNKTGNFPTIIINGKCIIGFDESAIRKWIK